MQNYNSGLLYFNIYNEYIVKTTNHDEILLLWVLSISKEMCKENKEPYIVSLLSSLYET